MKKVFLSLAVVVSLFASDEDDLLGGFDDGSSKVEVQKIVKKVQNKKSSLTGKLSQSFLYSKAKAPHDDLFSAKSSLFLDYDKKFKNGVRFKANAKAYYDYLYDKNAKDFTKDELKEFRSEVELYDFFIEGSLTKNLDYKLGRQVVVWGKSDTIRVTDVLNSLDNRRPGLVDIEDLRLPSAMAKFTYYHDKWHISPIMILEQRWTKNPPFGSEFYPKSTKIPAQTEASNSTYAINIGREFDSADLDLYYAKIYPQDNFGLPAVDKLKKVDFYGTSFNIVDGSFLYKAEVAYQKDLVYRNFPTQKVNRTDTLLGVEYSGIPDTRLSLDTSKREFSKELTGYQKSYYQTAFRATSDFKNATLHANFLLVLNGKSLNKGGFSRTWIKYDINDKLTTNIGYIDYIGGSALMDKFKDNDTMFVDVNYYF